MWKSSGFSLAKVVTDNMQLRTQEVAGIIHDRRSYVKVIILQLFGRCHIAVVIRCSCPVN
jgi:hypothetical protein